MSRRIAAMGGAGIRAIARSAAGTRRSRPNLPPPADSDPARTGVAAPTPKPSDAPSSGSRTGDEAAAGGGGSGRPVVGRSPEAETAYLIAAMLAGALVVSLLVGFFFPGLVPAEFRALTPEQQGAELDAAVIRIFKLVPVALLIGLAVRVVIKAGPLVWGSIAFGLVVGTLTRIT